MVSTCVGGVVAAVFGGFGLDKGDFFSEPLRSLALPSTAFLREPLRLRLLLFWKASDMALRPVVAEVRSFSLSLFSPSVVRRMFKRERRLPEIDLLCGVAGLFFSLRLALGVSSWMVGKGTGDSASFASVAESFIARQMIVGHCDHSCSASVKQRAHCKNYRSDGMYWQVDG